MKKHIIKVVFIVFSAMIFQNCDYVRYKPVPIPPFTFKPGVVYRKVLIEDYTGHQCGNCPKAATELTKIENGTNGFQVVPIAVHAGFYARLTAPTFTTDLRSTAGTTWDATFGNSAAGNPNGLVNRINYGQSNFIESYSSWTGNFARMDTMVADFQITILNAYDTASKQLTATITSKAMKNLTGTYNLSVVLTEDSILAEQEDYTLPSSNQINPAYVFNHVLRGAINGTWGEQVFNGSISNGQTISKTYFNFSVPSTYKAKNCHVIAFIYDASSSSSTYYEVFQAETQPLF